MGIELARLFLRVRSDMSQAAPDIKAGRGPVVSAAQSLSSSVNQVLATIGVGMGVSVLKSKMEEFIALAERQVMAEQRVVAVVRATGSAAGFTAEELKKQAAALQKVTTVGDEAILETQAILLTFKAVTKDTFRRATESALDLAAVLGTDAKSGALQLGKALEDPIRGITALRRAGVSFSEAEKEQIRILQESGRLREAQVVILKGVEGQVKGVARALAETDIGRMQQQKNILGDLQEVIGMKLVPVKIQLIKLTMDLTEALSPLVSTFTNIVSAVSKNREAVSFLIKGLVPLIATMASLKAVVWLVSASFTMLVAHPIVAAFTVMYLAAKKLIDVFLGVKEGLDDTSDAITELRQKEDQQRKQHLSYLDRLGELSKKNKLNNSEMKLAREIIAALTGAYGDLGISLDEATGKLSGVVEATQKATEMMFRHRKERLEEEIDATKHAYEERLRLEKKSQKVAMWTGGIFGDYETAAAEREAAWKKYYSAVTELRRLKTEESFVALTGEAKTQEDVITRSEKAVKQEIEDAEYIRKLRLEMAREKTDMSVEAIEDERKRQDKALRLDYLRRYNQLMFDSVLLRNAKERNKLLTELDVQRFKALSLLQSKFAKEDQERIKGMTDELRSYIQGPLDEYRDRLKKLNELALADALDPEMGLAVIDKMRQELMGQDRGQERWGRMTGPEIGRAIQDALIGRKDEMPNLTKEGNKDRKSLLELMDKSETHLQELKANMGLT